MTFSAALRAQLSSEPDILLLNSETDSEEISLAIEAAQSARLVLSTSQTENVYSTLKRLVNQCSNKYEIADHLLGIVSLKRTKTLCTNCKVPYKPDSAELKLLAKEYIQNTEDSESDENAINLLVCNWERNFSINGDIEFYKARGCENCLNTGYHGYTNVHQLLVNTPEIKKMFIDGQSAKEIEQKAICQSMQTHKQDGIEKVLLGYIDISQALAL